MGDYQVVRKLFEKDFQKCVIPGCYLKSPQIVNIMSFDGITFDEEPKLRYFKTPKKYPINLKEGFDEYIFRNESYYKANLIKMEKYIMEKEEEEEFTDNAKTRIVTQRSFLHDVMKLNYRFTSSRSYCATKFKNVIYLQNMDKDGGYDRTPESTYHFKLVQNCFSDSPDEDPVTDVPVNENEQTYCIYKSQIKNFDLLYSAEINGILSNRKVTDVTNMQELNNCRFVYTKLRKQLSNNRDWRTHPNPLNFWLKSYLSKVNDIYVGQRDDEGYVQEPLQYIAVNELPKVRGQKWKPEICNQILYTFLDVIDKKMSSVNCPWTVYEFKYDSNEKSIKYKIHEGKTKQSFLSESFIDYLKKKN